MSFPRKNGYLKTSSKKYLYIKNNDVQIHEMIHISGNIPNYYLSTFSKIPLTYLNYFGYNIEMYYNNKYSNDGIYDVNKMARKLLLCNDLTNGNIPNTNDTGPYLFVYLRDKNKSLTMKDYHKILSIVNFIEKYYYGDDIDSIPLDINVKDLLINTLITDCNLSNLDKVEMCKILNIHYLDENNLPIKNKKKEYEHVKILSKSNDIVDDMCCLEI